MLTLITGVLAFMISVYILRRNIIRLERENARLRSIIKGMRKQMDKMVERPF